MNEEKYDKSNFIKNVLLDNVLPGDIYLKARELRFNADVIKNTPIINSKNTQNSILVGFSGGKKI